MLSHEMLEPYYKVEACVTCKGASIISLRHLKTMKYRVGYHLAGEARWRLSPECSENFAVTLWNQGRKDVFMEQGKLTGLRHMIRIYARECMPSRFKEHRARMEQYRERNALKALPHFGMF
jgi:hypothetical protein